MMGADEMEGINVAEVIPYESFVQRIRIVKQELRKNRHIEIWENCIYSTEKKRC